MECTRESLAQQNGDGEYKIRGKEGSSTCVKHKVFLDWHPNPDFDQSYPCFYLKLKVYFTLLEVIELNTNVVILDPDL